MFLTLNCAKEKFLLDAFTKAERCQWCFCLILLIFPYLLQRAEKITFKEFKTAVYGSWASQNTQGGKTFFDTKNKHKHWSVCPGVCVVWYIYLNWLLSVLWDVSCLFVSALCNFRLPSQWHHTKKVMLHGPMSNATTTSSATTVHWLCYKGMSSIIVNILDLSLSLA